MTAEAFEGGTERGKKGVEVDVELAGVGGEGGEADDLAADGITQKLRAAGSERYRVEARSKEGGDKAGERKGRQTHARGEAGGASRKSRNLAGVA